MTWERTLTGQGAPGPLAEVIRGTVRVLRVLVATDPVGTQGPVWYLAGRTV